MPIGVLFWVLMILWLLFGAYRNRPVGEGRFNLPGFGGDVLVFVLFGLLGWRVFGPVLQ
jgi:hypothetical protein